MEKPPNPKFHATVTSLLDYKVKKAAQEIQEQDALDNYIRTLTCNACDSHEFMLVADSNTVICSNCQLVVQVEYTTTHITEDSTDE
jgi:transcription elongation factor Elf1